MHVFFTPSFEPLQAMLVDCLAEEGVHAVLPLLGVNRLLRSLAVSRMLREYKKTRVVRWDKEGKKVKMEEMALIPVLSEGDTSFDPITMLCTFKPPDNAVVCYALFCDSKHNVHTDVRQSFELTPSAWFREAAADSKTAHLGLELAARPDRYPPCYEYSFFPDAPKNPGPFTEEAYEAGYDGFEMLDAEETLRDQRDWKVSYHTCRFDLKVDADVRDSNVCVPASLTVKELKVPFIDLFSPRHPRHKRGYYDDHCWCTP
ncbi:hypothetical protein JCM8097_003807 [Rhodosporidiobolus ruineniae]